MIDSDAEVIMSADNVVNIDDRRQRKYIHEFEGPDDGNLASESFMDWVRDVGGQLINVHSHGGTTHIIIAWSSRERAEQSVRRYYTEAGVDAAMLADMVADVHECW